MTHVSGLEIGFLDSFRGKSRIVTDPDLIAYSALTQEVSTMKRLSTKSRQCHALVGLLVHSILLKPFVMVNDVPLTY